jgi:uncharacterized YccA/Bax inhibitor family protein
MSKRKQYFDVGHGAEQGLLNMETTATGEPHRKAKAKRPLELDEIAEKAGTENLGNAIKKKLRTRGRRGEAKYPYNIKAIA